MERQALILPLEKSTNPDEPKDALRSFGYLLSSLHFHQLQVTVSLTYFSMLPCSGGPGRPGMNGLPGQPGANGRDIYAVLEQASDDQHVRVKLANQTTDYALPLLLRSDGGVGSSGGNGGAGGTWHC